MSGSSTAARSLLPLQPAGPGCFAFAAHQRRREPFVLEATFTRNIPNVDNANTWIDRIWLDPAGRLIIAYNNNVLAILFPTGRVPPEIRQMMPPEKAKRSN